jgi:diaminopropionate ammonia-lyase
MTMLTSNPHALRMPYPNDLKQILNIAAANESRDWLSHWHLLRPNATPLWEMPGTAEQLNVAQLSIKDESVRSELGSFKALGAPIALLRLVLREQPGRQLGTGALLTGSYADLLANMTVISATDGNHGRALAAAAQSIGCRCFIVLHAKVSREREQAIAAYGAQIVRITGNYDESVEEAARLAAANRWHVVSDTSYTGYEDIPRDVMQGYSAIAAEIIEQSASQPDQPAFTHVVVQGGVGGLAAGIASFLWEFHGPYRPHLIVVEPQQADCLFQSAIQGAPAHATGSVDSVMAGLACGATSPLAWKFLEPSIDHFLTIEDAAAVGAMRILAVGNQEDVPIIAGESGAAGMAGLEVLLENLQLTQAVGLDSESRVLLINTEGATDPYMYHDLVGEAPEVILKRQATWLAEKTSWAQ